MPADSVRGPKDPKLHVSQSSRAFPFQIVGITPLEYPDGQLARALNQTEALAVLDLGRDVSRARQAFGELASTAQKPFGVRLCADIVHELPDHEPLWQWVVGEIDSGWEAYVHTHRVLVQVRDVEEAHRAAGSGAYGLIAKGDESGGGVGEESCYILLQRLIAESLDLPILAQGGIGRHTAAAAIAGGADAVVLDSQLVLMRESTLPKQTRDWFQNLDGSETRVVNGYRVLNLPGSAAANLEQANEDDITDRFGWSDISEELIPAGQDAALAKPLAQRLNHIGALIHDFLQAMSGHLRQARALEPLAADSPLARAHGTRFPIAQGPMTRVSDTAGFADAVAEAGGLPFLALSLLRPDQVRRLMTETRELVGNKPWGVGILGFAPAELREAHIALIREFKPPVVLIAGGRPSQARALENDGIQTYLHVPAPGLLDLFLKDGARRFVFEGRECGGHVGPRSSFTLWEQQIERLRHFDHPEKLQLLFAGGIHDARSAAMVAAMTGPLAARGAKIGVLMGTAYIATREAVQSGAVLPEYQEQMLRHHKTVLLETAPGHATRCLDTPFAAAFETEKRRLREAGREQREIWETLEKLNVGRLRIASKGIERQGDRLVEVTSERRLREGMVMIGQVAAMHREPIGIDELHQRVTTDATKLLEQTWETRLSEVQPTASGMKLAIVGMACVYPGAPDLDSFWSNIINGVDAVREVPAERWRIEDYYDPEGNGGNGKTGCKWGGFIDPVAFDPLSYGIPPQSLAAIEPVQLLALEVARRALADSGYDQREFDRERTSVIFGAESGTDLGGAYGFRNMFPHFLGNMPAELDAALPRLTEDSFPGVLANVIAGRIANRLDLGGVNYTVDAACASSLTAVELAAKELICGTSDMVLAGGGDLHNSINDYLMFSSVHALSRKGACRSFDGAADGIVLGEGVAAVVLKRLADAERDGDRIYAVLEGIAGSSDGKSLGLTAPRKEGQVRALRRAYLRAGVTPGAVGLVEAHGTGTVVGDRTELQTLTEVFVEGGALPGTCGLGSVKSQIGHTKCAAGIAGLIKCAKALYHKVLPPTLHIENPNDIHQPDHSPFTLNATARPWSGNRRVAGVSAFGFGGTNFHAVLGAPPQAQRPETGLEQWPVELFLFRAPDPASARQRVREMHEYLGGDAPVRLRDLALTAARDVDHPVWFALLAENEADLLAKLKAIDTGETVEDVWTLKPDSIEPDAKVAFLFPGQGSQRPGMLAEIFVAFPQLNDILEMGAPWRDRLHPPTAHDPAQREAQRQAITDTRVAQPVLGMTGLAMKRLLDEVGCVPDMLAGHSYGELVALCAAGGLAERDLLPLSEHRGICLLEAAGDDPGTMAAVSASPDTIAAILGEDSEVVSANLNHPQQTVISGTTAAVEHAMERLEAASIAAKRIPVACAFHSPVVAKAETTFAEKLAEGDIGKPELPVFANTTAARYPEDPTQIRALLAEHLVSPVRFTEQIEAMYRAGARIFVEVGAGSVLTNLTHRILKDRPHHRIVTDRVGEPGLRQWCRALAELAILGKPIDPSPLLRDRGARVLDMTGGPAELPATTWFVDGLLAKPKRGAMPAHGLKIMSEPVQLPSTAPQVAASAERDQTVMTYLQSVREMVQASREVMLGYLGRQPADPVQSLMQPTLDFATESAVDREQWQPVGATIANGVEAEATNRPHPGFDTKTTLLALVAERTGYPEDMLDLDLDLEADLSIDSIKRIEIIGELAERLGFKDRIGEESDALMEELASQKTLRSMLTWLDQMAPSADDPVAAMDSANEPTADLRTLLLHIVGERTGYPEEVLDLDLDLEADLSIDSIKRLEIVGELADRLGMSDMQSGDQDEMVEALAAMKTLRAIVDWLERQRDRSAEASGAATRRPTGDIGAARGDEDRLATVSRYVLAVDEVPHAIKGDHRLQGMHFLITDDTMGLAPALGDRLVAHGAQVRIIATGEKASETFGHVDGLIHLGGLAPSAYVTDIKQFFELMQTVLINGARYLLAAGGMGGGFGHYRHGLADDDMTFSRGGGIAGLVKSVAKEWPELRAHWVDLNLEEAVEDLASYLETELLADKPLTEVAYADGNRRAVRVVEATLPAEVESTVDRLELGSDSVILVTGGARGITAKIAIELARRYGCRMELVGRSPIPEGEEPGDIAAAADLRTLRRVLIERGGKRPPSEIESEANRILARREIRATLSALHQAGSEVTYTALDVRDHQAFESYIEGVYERHGTIDGVIHGAGVVEDKLLRHKTTESFERVFDTKVFGALVLAKQLREDTRFVVFFSSVAGAFGNRGQVDYAAANDVLDKIAHSLQTRLKGRVVSINWGPWAGRGMVSPELEREYARRGIGLIPLESGVAAFMNELHHGSREDTQVVLMCASPESMT
ncbi:SDR family NAD(P)-dependent oxidoreductase [Sulfidibacter corallicola]